MMCTFESPPESYKSFKARKFNEYIEKARKLVNAVCDTSLNEQDKKALLNQMKEKFNL